MIKELFGYIGKQPSYSEGSACATPTAMPTITTTQNKCDGQWSPTHTYDDCGIPIDDDYPARFMQQPPDRPRHEDDFPIYRWESNIKGVDAWVKINDAEGADTLIGAQSSLVNSRRVVVTRNNSLRHSDEHLLKMLGAHPRQGST